MKTPRASFACAHFQVDGATRQILRGGLPQPVQPKVFDLLAHLIEHRHRVVSKAELLEAVWPGGLGHGNVVARTVMKARLALGDTGGGHAFIRTFQRVGYRFMANEPDTPAVPKIGVAAARRALRIALLPMGSPLSEPQFGWIPLGLPSLIAQAFEFDARFELVPFGTMLQLLDTLTGPADPARRADFLNRMLGTDCVIAGLVDRVGDRYSIHYQGHGTHGAGLAGRIEGTELTGLGLQLAHRIEAHLFPAHDPLLHFDSIDTLANQAYARACEARFKQQFTVAKHLLRVVLDIEPASTAALLLHLQVMVATVDPGMQQAGENVLAHAQALGNSRVAAQAHGSMALAGLLRHGLDAATVHHSDEALRLIGDRPCDAASLRIYGICGLVAQTQGDDDRARVLFKHCITEQQRSGDRLALSLSWVSHALSDARRHELGAARALLLPALDFQRENHQIEGLFNTLSMLAYRVDAPSGQWRLALERCDEANRLLSDFELLPEHFLQAASMSFVYAEFAQTAPIDRLLTYLRPMALTQATRMHAVFLCTQAHRFIAAGESEAAREPLRAALDIMLQTRSVPHVHTLAGQWLRNELRCGHIDHACASADEWLAHEPCLREHREFQGQRLHAQAAALHARGDRAGAALRLAEAIERLPAGISKALARLDAAGLAVERGAVAEAEAQLQGLDPWLAQHPVGQAVHARLHVARGDLPAARAICEAGLRTAPSAALRALRAWTTDARTKQGAQQGAQRGAQPTPPSLQLPSLMNG